MTLIIEFQEALLKALKNYKKSYDNKIISMPLDREKEVFELNTLLKRENNILKLRRAFIERYHAINVPGIVRIFPFFDKCLLRKSLKEILFDKKYSEKALKNDYLNELINDRTIKSEEKQALLAKIQELENELLEMRKQNHKLRLERSYLLNINRTLRYQNSKLKELLKNNNIPLEEYDMEEYFADDNESSLKEINAASTHTEKTHVQENTVSSSTQPESLIKTEADILPQELLAAQKQIIEMKAQIKLLIDSKEKMLNSNLKELQKEIKELDAAEEEIQNLETKCSITPNTNTNVTQSELSEASAQELNNSALPYFSNSFKR